MAEQVFETAVAFLPQSALGTYNTTLAGITSSLSYTQGLLLGDPGSGAGASGLSLSASRISRERPTFPGSLTTQISQFLRGEVDSLQFVFPWTGNRADTTGTPVDADFPPIAGVDALLLGAGLVGAASGTPGHVYVGRAAASIVPFSALIFVSGNRYELVDCFCSSLSIAFTPGDVPIATATIVPGAIADWNDDAIPGTLTFGEQATVSGAVVEQVAHTWGNLRGFTTQTLNMQLATELVPDSNAANGTRTRVTGRTIEVQGTHIADDTSGTDYDRQQLLAAAIGDLDALTFQVGAAAVGADPALAQKYTLPTPELRTTAINAVGTSLATDVSVIARGSAAETELLLEYL